MGREATPAIVIVARVAQLWVLLTKQYVDASRATAFRLNQPRQRNKNLKSRAIPFVISQNGINIFKTDLGGGRLCFFFFKYAVDLKK